MDLIVFFNTLFGFFTFVAWAISLSILFLIFTKKRFSKIINDQFYNFATSVTPIATANPIARTTPPAIKKFLFNYFLPR